MDPASPSGGAEAGGDELLVAPPSPADRVSKMEELLGVLKMGEVAGNDATQELAEVGEKGGASNVFESGKLTGVSERSGLLTVLENMTPVGAVGTPIASVKAARGPGRTMLLPEATIYSPVAVEEPRAPRVFGSSGVSSIRIGEKTCMRGILDSVRGRLSTWTAEDAYARGAPDLV